MSDIRSPETEVAVNDSLVFFLCKGGLTYSVV